ncbi:MAG: hypothetical protein WCW77_04820 [Patescibacteria group bacterium]|jgi:hypothetical protein
MKISFKIFRIAVWLVLALVAGWLSWQKIVPGGKISYTYDFTRDNYFIGKLSPSERVRPPENGTQVITGDPVYFSLTPPRRFEKARLIIKYKIESKDKNHAPPIIEAGILKDQFWHYDLKPIENSIISGLAKKWSSITENDLILLQKEIKYKSVDEFLKNLPPLNQIATYNYNLNHVFRLQSYKPEKQTRALPASIRGPYGFYVYINNEELNLNFDFLDLNKNLSADPIKVRVMKGSKLIMEKELADDGDRSDSGKIGYQGKINIKQPGLAEGVYNVEVLANDDIVTSKIATAQSKISFIKKIWIYDSKNFPLRILTDNDGISAQTSNPSSIQGIETNSGSLELKETYKQFDKKLTASLTDLTLKKGDTLLSGDGMFAFSSDELFDPEIKKITQYFDAGKNNTEYIIARYIEPEQKDAPADGQTGWMTAAADFDITGAYRENGKFNFMLSIPGLKIDDGIDDSVIVKEIHVDLEGKNLWEKISSILR